MTQMILKPLTLVLRTLPDGLHIEFLSRLFNHLLRGQDLAVQLHGLEGKRIVIAITDTATELRFHIRNGRLRACPVGRGSEPDVCIRGRLEDFWLLATGREDPDTLFFERRLGLEGETEAGLYLKNMLDALEFDWEAHLRAVLGPGPGTRLARMIGASGKPLA